MKQLERALISAIAIVAFAYCCGQVEKTERYYKCWDIAMKRYSEDKDYLYNCSDAP